MKEKNINNNGKNRAYYQALRARYLNLAKEASTSGDRILKEYNLQFAEHYGRILSEKFPQTAQTPQQISSSQKQNISEQSSTDNQTSTTENAKQSQEPAQETQKAPKKRVMKKASQKQKEVSVAI